MQSALSSVSTLLLSVAILLLGHGLQLTVAPLYASELGWSATEIGYTGSAYFTGFLIGCLTIPRLVARVGHIRVFGVLTSFATVALLLLALFDSLPAWLVARLITGWCFAGLYMVIESWLNDRAGAFRGAILSVYTIITLVAIAAGQMAVAAGYGYPTYIVIGAMILSLGAIPVGLTRSPAPPIEPVSFKFRTVYNASRVAVLGAFIGGTVTSGFWALGPVLASSMGIGPAMIGFFMAATIIGGAVFQFPVGRASDFIDRRRVLYLMAFGGTVVCLAAIMIAPQLKSAWGIVGLMFLFGGLTFPIYSICVAQANDNSELGMVEIASVILMMHSLGSIVGPLIVAPLMDLVPTGLFVYAGVMLGAFGIWASGRARVHDVTREFFAPFRSVPRTTHEIGSTIDALLHHDDDYREEDAASGRIA